MGTITVNNRQQLIVADGRQGNNRDGRKVHPIKCDELRDPMSSRCELSCLCLFYIYKPLRALQQRSGKGQTAIDRHTCLSNLIQKIIRTS